MSICSASRCGRQSRSPTGGARLKAAQVKFDRDLHDGIYGLTIYVFDPDGNMIELYEEGAKMP